MKRIIRGIGNGFFVVALLIVLSAAVMAILQVKPVIVVSGSMEPAIETGSLVLINTRNPDVEKGDVIAFERGEIMVVHRAIRETAEGWITKGDNNACEDPGIVGRESIRGTTVLCLPKVGYILAVLRPFG
ncbi:MAG: signal peptidase I [Lentihominibacter sp.]|jgi:signal peptidase